jgi:hypothetical protein
MPFFIGGMAWMFSSAAAPNIPFVKNPLSIFCAAVMLAGCVMSALSRIYKWDWRVRYFGLGAFYVGSVSLLGIIPWLCIVLYSGLPIFMRFFLLLSYSTVATWWCWRFVLCYRKVMSDDKWYSRIYVEDNDAVYYLQKNDSWILNNNRKFRQVPSTIVFVLMSLSGFLVFPFADAIYSSIGVPVMYAFMSVSFFPLVLMSLGLMTRGYLIYYHYPRKIRIRTCKDVYIDMTSKTLP